MIDLHCHVLAGVDDGAATIQDALALCRAAVEAGTDTVVATSHVSWDYPGTDPVVVHTGVTVLNAALRDEAISLRVLPGAEFGLSRVADLSDAHVGVLRLGGGPYALIECPHHGGAAVGIEDAVRRFARRGHRVVLGHPERSVTLRNVPRLLAGLVQDGVLSCITARSLTGDFGSAARENSWQLLEAGLVHAIASDAHNVPARPPDLGPTLERAGLTAREIDYFSHEVPAAVFSGSSVPPPPRISAERSGLRRRHVLRRRRLTSWR